jgi:P-type E1-E2 ATPase
VFDKTGTLTRGEPVVTDLLPEKNISEDELLSVASALESRSEHPLARAIVRKMPSRLSVRDFRSHGGKGVSGIVEGVPARLGSADFLSMEPKAVEGKSVVGVMHGERFLGWIALADELCPTTAAAVARLRAMGIEPHPVRRRPGAVGVAAQLGIELEGGSAAGRRNALLGKAGEERGDGGMA